ncbi:MAG: xanthine dehydrogenase molybdenum-binding subunit, partial [Thermoleophilaceae bacterium]|nr:xanthine dehydrogenase molybdenum-binding subunit [Thermoleophilaceae bacterium]
MSVELAPPPVAAQARDRSPVHQDFVQKVAGELAYADDWAMPGMLHGVVIRASAPCGRITRLDTGAARSVPGVHTVITAADVPHNVIAEEASGLGLDPIVMPVLAAETVRYDGEPIALVAAETPWAAA